MFIGNYRWRSHISSGPKFQEKKLFLCNCCLNVGRCPAEPLTAMWLGGGKQDKGKKSRTSPSCIQHPEHATCRSALTSLLFNPWNTSVSLGHVHFGAQDSHCRWKLGHDVPKHLWRSRRADGKIVHKQKCLSGEGAELLERSWTTGNPWWNSPCRPRLCNTIKSAFVSCQDFSFNPQPTKKWIKLLCLITTGV